MTETNISRRGALGAFAAFTAAPTIALPTPPILQTSYGQKGKTALTDCASLCRI